MTESTPAKKTAPAKKVAPTKAAPAPVEDKSEIDELKAQLAALQAQLAAVQVPVQVSAAPAVPDFSKGSEVTIHMVEDGFTFAGRVWYRGQEIAFEVGTDDWSQTLDRYGESWVRLAYDERAQAKRLGRVFFRPGPWQGLGYEDAEDEFGKKIDPEIARQSAEREAARQRTVPTPPPVV